MSTTAQYRAKNKLMGTLSTGEAVPGKVPYEQVSPKSRSLRVEKNKANKLTNILGREELKSKKERVAHVLVQNFTKKYGSQYKPIIQFYVEEICDKKLELSSEDVDDLEINISKAIDATRNGELNQFQQKKTNNQSQGIEKNEEQSSSSKTQDTSYSNMKPPPGSEWLTIMTYQNILGEEKTKQEQALIKENKKKFKNVLDKQMVEVEKAKSGKKVEDKDYYHTVVKDVLKYEEEQKVKSSMRDEEAKKQFQFQQEQIAANQRRRELERAEAEAIDQHQISLAKLALQQEEDKIKAMKEKEAERRRVVEIENERNKEIQAEQKRLRALEDQKLAAEYAAKLDREDAARAAAFEARMAKMGKMGAKFESEGAGKAMREAKIREEKLLLLEQQRKEERDRAAELKKKEDARQRNLLDLQENGRQVAERRSKAEQEKILEKEFRIKFKEEAEAYKQGLIQEKVQDKQKRRHYKGLLSDQIDHLKGFDRNLTGCSSVEAEINKPIFSELEKNPHMMSRVMHRMRMDAGKK